MHKEEKCVSVCVCVWVVVVVEGVLYARPVGSVWIVRLKQI